MVNCAAVCDASSTTVTSYIPPTTGAISCGRMLQLLKGASGYNDTNHWCTTGCDLLGCPKGKNPWRCIPGRQEVVRKIPDGGIACLLAPASSTPGGTVNGQPCMACPVAVEKATGYIPSLGRIVRVPCTDGACLFDCAVCGVYALQGNKHYMYSTGHSTPFFFTQPSTRTPPRCAMQPARACSAPNQQLEDCTILH